MLHFVQRERAVARQSMLWWLLTLDCGLERSVCKNLSYSYKRWLRRAANAENSIVRSSILASMLFYWRSANYFVSSFGGSLLYYTTPSEFSDIIENVLLMSWMFEIKFSRLAPLFCSTFSIKRTLRSHSTSRLLHKIYLRKKFNLLIVGVWGFCYLSSGCYLFYNILVATPEFNS